MSESKIFTPKEAQPINHSIWLSGLFEIGGSMFLEIQKRKSKSKKNPEVVHTYTRPVISIVDNHPEICQFPKILGYGSTRPYRRGKKSHRWSLKGPKVVDLTTNMKPTSPLRQETIIAFENWGTATTEERLEIARELKQTSPPLLKLDDYTDLVQKPQFLAGVLDGRGMLIPQEHYNKEKGYGVIHPRLRISSLNKPLLLAIQNLYQGYFGIQSKEGEIKQFTRKAKAYKFRNTSYQLQIGSPSAIIEILQKTLPYLKIDKNIDTYFSSFPYQGVST